MNLTNLIIGFAFLLVLFYMFCEYNNSEGSSENFSGNMEPLTGLIVKHNAYNSSSNINLNGPVSNNMTSGTFSYKPVQYRIPVNQVQTVSQAGSTIGPFSRCGSRYGYSCDTNKSCVYPYYRGQTFFKEGREGVCV